MDYGSGIVWTLLSAFLCQFLGIAITKRESHYSYSFVIGYIVYSFLVAVVGIPIQLLELPWHIFFYYMIGLWVVLIVYIVIRFIHRHLSFSFSKWKDYMAGHWFLYVGAIVLTVFGLMHIKTILENNNTDDGYYITKIATLPYTERPFRTDPVTGLLQTSNSKLSILSYLLNTFELEGSFYVYVLKINPVLYCRLFLSIWNNFILLNAAHAFMQMFLEKMRVLKSEKLLQYYLLPVFLVFVMSLGVFAPYDASWTVVTAAFYGSSLVRIGCTFIVLLPLLQREKMDWYSVVITCMSCVVMVSKSTVAVPLLGILAIGYLVVYGVSTKKMTGILFSLGLVGILFVIGWLIPGKDWMTKYLVEYMMYRSSEYLLAIALGILAICTVRTKTSLKLVFVILIAFACMYLPYLNNLFENASYWHFVAERTRYSLLIFTLIVAFTTLFVTMTQWLPTLFVSIGNVVLAVAVFTGLCISGITGAKPADAARFYVHNPYLLPNSTMALGKALEQSGKEHTVLMSAGIQVDSYSHFSSSILRTFTPSTRSVIGGLRIDKQIRYSDSPFNGFRLEDMQIYDAFATDPNEQTTKQLQSLCEKYPFDCIVGTGFNETHTNFLKSIGFEKVEMVEDPSVTYVIYEKQ